MPTGSDCLRVALIAGTLGRGGAEKQLFYIADGLRRAGVNVALFSLTRGEDYEACLCEIGVRPRWIGRFANPCIRLGDLIARLQHFRPHVVQSMHAFTNLYAAVGAKLTRALGFGAVRGNLAGMLQDYGRWTRYLLSAPHAVIANSDAAVAEIVRSGLLPRDRVYLLRNVIDFQQYGAPPSAFQRHGCRVVFVGRLIPAKRADRFLRALAVARATEPTLEGWVVGDGPQREAMQHLAADLDFPSGSIRFLGSRNDLPALLQYVDMLALTSDSEGSPNVILEAMAASLPVITTPAGDAGTLVQEGVSGFVVPFDDVDLLAKRLTLLARNPQRRRELGGTGRRRAEEVAGLDGLAGRLLSIYARMARILDKRQVLAALQV
jgi:glycosyltransferase involved in cell wall biosynthesis